MIPPPPRSTLFPYTTLFRSLMASKETKRKIREEVAADRARYDEVTRRLQERIDRGRARERERDAQDERSEEHTSELQSLTNLVCRLLLEKKKKNKHKSSR